MALDELIARRQGAGACPPSLRLYRWAPWAISLGRNQAEGEIDGEKCRRDGIDIVRRPTGGRAILHAEELTYCVVMHTERRSVLQVYNDISRALVRGLTQFGVDVSLQRSQPDFARQYRSAASVPCFASSARYEIEWRGRKLVGSAQRRYGASGGDIVLQHGSILCGPAHRRLAEYLATDDNEAVQAVQETLQQKTVDLSEITRSAIDLHALSTCIRRGFEEAWGIVFSPESEFQPEALNA